MTMKMKTLVGTQARLCFRIPTLYQLTANERHSRKASKSSTAMERGQMPSFFLSKLNNA